MGSDDSFDTTRHWKTDQRKNGSFALGVQHDGRMNLPTPTPKPEDKTPETPGAANVPRQALTEDDLGRVIVLLNDGETYTTLAGCRLIGLPEHLCDAETWEVEEWIRATHAWGHELLPLVEDEAGELLSHCENLVKDHSELVAQYDAR